ncbi:hypothetical protein GCM10027289_23850 [Tsukamurella serpentis]
MNPRAGRTNGRRERALARAREIRLDAALAEYRDRTYAGWTAPGGAAVPASVDRRIVAALRAAPSPGRPRSRLVLGLAASAAAVTALAVTVALTTVEETTTEPETGVLLAAAAPGGDRGVFADQDALRRCLDAAAVPAARRTLLGSGPVDVLGDHATVLLLPGTRLGDLTVLAVTPDCARGAPSSIVVKRTLPATAR